MTTRPIVGGYTWRQECSTIRASIQEARNLLGRLLDERPGPALAALYLAQIGVALLRVMEAAEALERVGERKQLPGRTP
jgi:predicted Zn-dependent protease